MNKVTLLGRFTQDVKAETAKSGTIYLRNTLAVSRDKENTDFISIGAFSKTAENIAKFFKKGDRILIDGTLQVKESENNGKKVNYYSVLINSFDFIESKTKPDTKPAEDDDLPFEV